jgi:hypothetical protein
MLGADIQTDYDTNVEIQPVEYYHEPHLAVVITDAGHAAQARLSVENARRLVDYLNEWIEKASKAIGDGTSVNEDVDVSDIPF